MRIEGGNSDPKVDSAPPPTVKDEFLRMLVAQIQHQDPLEPQDGSAFIAQLAQFATLEQTAETNELLTRLEAGQASMMRLGYAGIVGKTVTIAAGELVLPLDGATTDVNLEGAAAGGTATIFDADGRPVRTLPLGARPAGTSPLEWDGRDEAGAPLPAGRYRVELSATDAGGKPVGASLRARVRVDAIELADGSVAFRAGGRRISPADILSVEVDPGVTIEGGRDVDLEFLVHGFERPRRVW